VRLRCDRLADVPRMRGTHTDDDLVGHIVFAVDVTRSAALLPRLLRVQRCACPTELYTVPRKACVWQVAGGRWQVQCTLSLELHTYRQCPHEAAGQPADGA
jgi:hypothetical protein